MKSSKDLSLFTAYLRYGSGTRERAYILHNCFLIHGRLAQLYHLRVRPVLIDLTRDQEARALQILCRSRGCLTSGNYKELLPYMLQPGKRRVECHDLTDPAAPTWLNLSQAIELP